MTLQLEPWLCNKKLYKTLSRVNRSHLIYSTAQKKNARILM